MPETTPAELLFHPVRMRIIVALARGAELTAQQLGETLADVPAPTLYRQLKKLHEGGVLDIVEERRVRGTVERVYALRKSELKLSPNLAQASREDHMRYFTTFVAALLGEYARYLRRDTIDPAADGVGYRQVVFHLSDEEFVRMVADLNRALAPYLALPPAPRRIRRLFSTIVMPVPGPEGAPGEIHDSQQGGN